MAAAKTKTTTKKETNKENSDIAELERLHSENQSLKSQFDTLKAQMEQMTKMMSQLPLINSLGNTQSNVEPKDIEVVNLTSGKLILTTTGKSDGRHYEFNNQFDKILVPEGDLKLIIKAMPRTTEGGQYFINDTEFVNKNGLSGVYRNIIPQSGIQDFFEKPYQEAMEIYHDADETQKMILESMIVDKCLNSEFVDGNVLMALTKETGKDFMNIEPLLKEG